ncbi:MAG: SemiSWEET transporter [Candidatus Sericytochromatia bacterium]|nr:SemiSWEET transporter [Candidatus Sericytochromatia bacterium]
MALNPDWLGLLAGTLTTIAFVPQVLKTWRSRSAEDLSLGMFSLFTVGIALWLIYGFWIKALPLILTNTITLGLAATLLFFKLRFGSGK